MEGRIESSNPQGTSRSLRKIAFSNENKHILTTYPLLALQHCHPQIPAKLSMGESSLKPVWQFYLQFTSQFLSVKIGRMNPLRISHLCALTSVVKYYIGQNVNHGGSIIWVFLCPTTDSFGLNLHDLKKKHRKILHTQKQGRCCYSYSLLPLG